MKGRYVALLVAPWLCGVSTTGCVMPRTTTAAPTAAPSAVAEPQKRGELKQNLTINGKTVVAGMSTEKVIEILGPPTQVLEDDQSHHPQFGLASTLGKVTGKEHGLEYHYEFPDAVVHCFFDQRALKLRYIGYESRGANP